MDKFYTLNDPDRLRFATQAMHALIMRYEGPLQLKKASTFVAEASYLIADAMMDNMEQSYCSTEPHWNLEEDPPIETKAKDRQTSMPWGGDSIGENNIIR